MTEMQGKRASKTTRQRRAAMNEAQRRRAELQGFPNPWAGSMAGFLRVISLVPKAGNRHRPWPNNRRFRTPIKPSRLLFARAPGVSLAAHPKVRAGSLPGRPLCAAAPRFASEHELRGSGKAVIDCRANARRGDGACSRGSALRDEKRASAKNF